MYFLIVITAIVSIVIIIILKHYFTNVFNYWSKRGVNGPIALPIFGNFITHLIKPANIIEEQRLHQYGRVYGTFAFIFPTLTIADPTLIREVTIKHFYNFQNRLNPFPKIEFFNKSMAFSKDDNWKMLRSSLSPVFTTKRMKSMFKYVDQCADNTLEYIHSIGNREVILKETMMSFTMDVITKCAFGVDTNGYKNPSNEFLLRAHDMAKVSIWRILLAVVVPKWIQKLHNSLEVSIVNGNTMKYFKNFLSSIINQRKMHQINNNDFVSLMLRLEELEDELESNKSSFDSTFNKESEVNEPEKYSKRNTVNNCKKKLTNEEILSQAFMFFLAGYETTSTLLNFTIYALAVNAEIQHKLYEEIVQCLDKEKGLNYDIIYTMPYLDAVINESLRMYSPIVVFNRVAAEDFVLGEQGIRIEKGTIINLSPYAIHHDPDFFPEPHTFDPKRFLPENKHLIEPYTFIPFGVGPRNCIALRFALMTAKIFIVKLLEKFTVIKTKNTAITPKYTIVFATLASEPLAVSFVSRNL